MVEDFPVGLRRRTALIGAVRRAGVAQRKVAGGDMHSRAEQYLTESLGSLKGLPQKIGQMLSMGRGSEPSRPLSLLTQHGVSTLPWARIRETVEWELGRPLASCFRRVSEIPLAAASLSQVHAAELNDGREVVIKVQYPGIERAIREDLQSLGWLGTLKGGFKLEEYNCFLDETLRRELDYGVERASLKTFSLRRECFPWLILPEPIDDLCSDKVLTMTRVRGSGLSVVCGAWSQSEKRLLGERILELFLDGLLERRILHADPHPGNYRFSMKGGSPFVQLLDFGCLAEVPAETAKALGEMISAVALNLEISWMDALVRMGFDAAALRPIHHKLGDVVRILFEPFASDEPFDMDAWNRSDRIAAALGADRTLLRTSAPASFFLVMRAFHGVTYYLTQLKAPISWRKVARRWFREPLSLTVPAPAMQNDGVDATSLCLLVVKDGELKVRLHMPASCALRLSEYVPDEIREKLSESRISVLGIEAQIRGERGLRPGTLFELRESHRTVRVWLE